MPLLRDRVVFLLCFSVLGLGLLSFSSFPSGADVGDVMELEAMVICDLEVDEPPVERVERIIAARSTFQQTLLEWGFMAGAIHLLVQDVKPVYDLSRVMAGHRLAIGRAFDGAFHDLEYHIDDEEYLLVRYDSGQYVASRHPYDFQVEVEEFYGEVDSSLWDTLVSQGESPQLVQALHQIFQWDIDFTAIRPGDSFKLIFEKKYLDGEFMKYGEILAVQFTSRARPLYAFLFESPQGVGYYHENGGAVRKPFLKAPFDFDPRITSGYSHSRFHPILKVRRPHLGVDYGAPVGTPVLASADGAVIFAGREGGFGNLVEIRHPNGYVTGYAHLSRIDVRSGQRVRQGERIGGVGSTGLATGPHLHYQVQDRSGREINPRELTALPSDEAVEKEDWTQFVSVRDELIGRLATISESGPLLNRIPQTD